MSVERATAHSRQRNCPACFAPSVMLPMFTSRRRTPVSCTSCGVKLQRVLPGAPYYTFAFLVGILAEPACLALLVLALLEKWFWVAAIILGFLLLNLGASAFLNSRTRVEFVDPKDARKDQPGRWYPH